MTKPRDAIKWLKSLIGTPEYEGKPTYPPEKSIMERLEGLIPPVDKIRDSYNVDRRIAEAAHKAMLSVEELVKETSELIKETLREQKKAIDAQELLLDQQEVTAGIIDVQYYKSIDAETIIQNLREWMFGDPRTIAWFLENVLIPAFTNAFAQQTAARQRKLFNGLRVAVNVLQKLDGILLEPQ